MGQHKRAPYEQRKAETINRKEEERKALQLKREAEERDRPAPVNKRMSNKKYPLDVALAMASAFVFRSNRV